MNAKTTKRALHMTALCSGHVRCRQVFAWFTDTAAA